MNELQECILDAVSIMANNAKNTGTLTIECTIKEVINAGVGEYKIDYLSNTFNAYASNPSIEYNIGDKIYVLIPEGDFSKQKIILGTSAPSTITYEPSDLNNYMQVSDNLLDNFEEIKLCTYKSEEIKITNENNNFDFNVLFPKYLKSYSTYGFSVKIKTNIPIEQQINGNYGLKLSLPFYVLDKNNEKVEIDKIYTFDVNTISGNPYRLTEWSNQTMFIQFSSDEKYDTERKPQLSAFVKDFATKDFKEEEDIPYDIFIKDIKFATYDILTEEHKVGYYLHLSASEGNYFFEGSSQEKTLIPHLKASGRDVKLTNTVSALEEVYKCYWFKEDASIKNTSDFYSSIGGIGWKCLNQRTNVYSNADGSLSFDLITNQYSYVINKDEVLTSARFKCVIVISKKSANGAVVSTTVSNIIKLENIDSVLDIDIVSATGSNSYIKNIGEVNLICNIIDKDKENSLDDIYPNYIITYEWNRYDKNGNYLDNNFYSVVSNKDEIITDVHYISQQIKFATNLIETANIFTCSAYINYIKDEVNQKVNQIKLLGTESILIDTNGTAAFNLSIQNGDVLYKYDAEGDSPLRENYDGPLESKVDMIKPLTYTIYKADGTELTDSEYNYCQTTWLIPVNSLITPNNLSQLPIDGEYYVYSGVGHFEFNYTLANTYNFKKINNTIILKVKFGEVDLTAAAAIKILKEGENGTNNSNYTAVIEHNGAAYGEYHEGIIQKFQAIYCAEENEDYGVGWYYHNLNYKTNELSEIESFNPTSKTNRQLNIKVYRTGELINENYEVEWSMFDEANTNPCMQIDSSSLKEKCYIEPKIFWETETDVFVNIVQAKITISNKDTNEFTELYAYYPIEIIRVDNFDLLKRSNIDGTESLAIPSCINGFFSVLYASDGTNPKYNSSEPFTCTDAIYSSNISAKYNDYNWEVNSNLTVIKEENNQAKIKPCSKYDSSESKNYVKVSLKLNSEIKEKIDKEIDAEKTNYEKNKELVTNTKNEKDALETFFKGENYISQSTMISALNDAKTFIDKRAIMLNSLDEVEKRLKLIYDYSEELAKLIDEDEKRKEQIKNARTQLREVIDIDNLQIEKIDTEDIKKVIKEKDKRKALTNLSKDYNNSVDKYVELDLPSSDKFMDLTSVYQDILTELEKIKSYSNLYQQLNSIKNKFTIDSDQCCITYTSILNDIINQTYKLLSQYGNEDGLNEVTKNYYDNLILEYENVAAAALQKTKELQAYLIQAETAIIYIRPIVMTFNRYELSNIVGWDGNKLYTGTGNNGDYLYAPQVGAGKKEGTGAFTGIVIGNAFVGGEEKIGLFGYSEGAMSIFLNARTGSATFGKSGAGQIEIDPNQNKAIIRSGNYSTTDKTGMQIDLTTPEIRFGSGNFVVNEKGEITAKGGGSVAGWKITNTQLHSNVNETDGRITLDSGVVYKIDEETKEEIKEYTSGKVFSHNHNTLDSKSTGFYLSQDGLSIGNSIRVNSVEGGSIEIGRLSSNRYWTINGDSDDSYIKYGTVGKSKSVYIGTDKISLGTKFSVDNDGNLIASNITANGNGFIGGWEIGADTLKGKNIILDSTGSIKAVKDKDTKWSINSDGDAIFKDITCNGKWSFGSGDNTWTDNGFNFGNGDIGGNTVNGSLAFTNGTVGLGTTGKGANGISFNGNKCIIAGDIYANNGYFSGEVNATSGSLGNLTLKGNLTLDNSSGAIIFNGETQKCLKYYDNGVLLSASSGPLYLAGSDVTIESGTGGSNTVQISNKLTLQQKSTSDIFVIKKSDGSTITFSISVLQSLYDLVSGS